MAEMDPADVPHELLMAALAVVRDIGRQTEWGTSGKRVRAEEEQRRVLAVVLPLHEQQVREWVAAEQEQERQGALARLKREWDEAWATGRRDGALRILPDDAIMWRRRTPEERRAYLTDHRDEALAYGIPAGLVDLMIGDAKENADV